MSNVRYSQYLKRFQNVATNRLQRHPQTLALWQTSGKENDSHSHVLVVQYLGVRVMLSLNILADFFNRYFLLRMRAASVAETCLLKRLQ